MAKQIASTVPERRASLALERRKSRALSIAGLILFYLAISVFAIVMIMPLVWMLSTACKSLQETLVPRLQLIPEHFLLRENVVAAFSRVPMGRYFLNSVIVSTAHTIGELAMASLAGYSFARYQYPGRDVLFLIVLATMMIPFFVVIIPLFLVVYFLGWLDTYWALIVPGLVTGFGIFLMRQFMSTIPAELVDAGRIDGASEPMILFRIVLPLCGPALATLAIFTFMQNWDSYVWPLMAVSKSDMFTVPLGLAFFQTQYVAFWNEMMAAALIGMAPTYALFLAFQRYFVQGVVMSGIKG